ncbi:substrate-binding domain-containing protein [Lichenihabitans psoromatis]|uniref:substrate-binding domain-containing protein n=1 Tax=Lichenihabitans psoromatis TaxID=2528642 RepID=UPI00103839DF|nr:substrate-binding domain-containing protein [Lichenihabitans psoromatis]
MACKGAFSRLSLALGISIKVGLLIPMQGAAGIWGPSCEASARLAVAELNAGAGMLGQSVDLVIIDAGQTRSHVERVLRDIVVSQSVDALVGMHLSDLRGIVASQIPPDMPYVYTPLYEGGDAVSNVFAIGETPDRLLRPGIEWLTTHRRAERWWLIGNDYIWPHVVHRHARQMLRQLGCRVVGSALLPFDLEDYEPILDQIRADRPDAVLMSLIGEDAVRFNRAFAEAGLAGDVLRFATAIDENVLYGIGAENTENMHLSSGYFAHLRSPENDAFRERYHAAFGASPPVQNDIGQSCYEGLHYLAALMGVAGTSSAPAMRSVVNGATPLHRSARASDPTRERSRRVHLAVADGVDVRVVQSR